jgi:2-polyprenyl-3-methyl-5-hydroxy-6-metoxy-1,4-benzoquinol methylase
MKIQINLNRLNKTEAEYFRAHLVDFELPTQEDLFKLIDLAWDDCGCNSHLTDFKISSFYAHPVWLLNGIFSELDEKSVENRKIFIERIKSFNCRRIADFGGGYGALARLLSVSCPDSQIDIVEPYPHHLAVALTDNYLNVKFVPQLIGEYDLIIATDVFEHVADPLSLVEITSEHLKQGGIYLMANCFFPEIKCHLPQSLHFRFSWDAAMLKMNLDPMEEASEGLPYGKFYMKIRKVVAMNAKGIEFRSKFSYKILLMLPSRVRKFFEIVLFS